MMFGAIVLVLAALATDPAPDKDIWTAAWEGDMAALAPERQTIGIDELDPEKGWTPLIHAALGGHVEVLELLLRRGAAINRVGSDGSTALAAAAARGHLEAVEFLIARGAEVNRFEGSGHTPLAWASARNHVRVAERLLAMGANVDLGSRTGFTPLHEAAEYGHIESIELLVKAGADVDAFTNRLVSPLKVAAWNGRAAAVEALLRAGADPTSSNGDDTALGAAIDSGHEEIARILKRAGADLNVSLNFEGPAVEEACKEGMIDLARALYDAGSRPKVGSSALERTAREGHAECVNFLVEKGARLDSDDADELIADVIEEGHSSVVLALYQSKRAWEKLPEDAAHAREDRILGAVIDADDAAMTAVLAEEPVHNQRLVESAQKLAVLHGHYRMDRALGEYGRGVRDPSVGRAINAKTFVALCRKGDLDRARGFLRGGSDATAYDPDAECSAISGAVESNNLELVRLLLDEGADPNDPRGIYSPLLRAASRPYKAEHIPARFEIARLLLDRGADPNRAEGGGSSFPIVSASGNGWLEMLQLLLDRGANPNAVDREDVSAIAHAVKRDHVEVVRLLLTRGVTTDLADDYGRLPLDYARGYKHVEADALLVAAGAKLSGHELPSPLPDLIRADPAQFESYLERGVPPDARDLYFHKTPLQMLAEAHVNSAEMATNARLLIEYGANVREPSTMLHHLVRSPNRAEAPAIIRLMVEKGAPIDAQSRDYGGNTPLMMVSPSAFDVDMALLLLELGADPRLRNDRDQSALDLAKARGNQQLVKRLEDALQRWPQHNDGGNNL